MFIGNIFHDLDCKKISINFNRLKLKSIFEDFTLIKIVYIKTKNNTFISTKTYSILILLVWSTGTENIKNIAKCILIMIEY